MKKRRNFSKKLIKPDTPCGYCFSSWAVVHDHLYPAAHGGNGSDRNLYPSCVRCNALLSDKVFDTIESKREYVRLVLKARGEWDRPNKTHRVKQNTPTSARLTLAERHGISPNEVKDIIRSRLLGHSIGAIAISYLVTDAVIRRILTREVGTASMYLEGGSQSVIASVSC